MNPKEKEQLITRRKQKRHGNENGKDEGSLMQALQDDSGVHQEKVDGDKHIPWKECPWAKAKHLNMKSFRSTKAKENTAELLIYVKYSTFNLEFY